MWPSAFDDTFFTQDTFKYEHSLANKLSYFFLFNRLTQLMSVSTIAIQWCLSLALLAKIQYWLPPSL